MYIYIFVCVSVYVYMYVYIYINIYATTYLVGDGDGDDYGDECRVVNDSETWRGKEGVFDKRQESFRWYRFRDRGVVHRYTQRRKETEGTGGAACT